ncbi:enoyl-CoA hydratase/isomerase family protein [Reyranella sp.]|uniref:enoyl-CoA hydratase/isomerase family protein n=1 Tax=Reyranella sp. TaxID=1929291 RepID=UPI003BA958B3
MSGEASKGKIDLDHAGGVATLWIDNPAHRNALNNTLIEAMTGHYRALAADSACRVIVVRGRGGIFCAGRELRDLRALQDADNATIVATYDKLKALNEAVWFCPKPTVAVVEKYAFGAGATLTSWCDIAVAEEEALFAYPEVHHGFPPSPALMALFLAVGRKKAMDLVLSGRRIDAREADRIGLITRAVPAGGLDADLRKLLESLLRSGPDAVRRTKEFVWHSDEAGHRAAMASAVDSISLGLASPQAREGIAAFFEKRRPHW